MLAQVSSCGLTLGHEVGKAISVARMDGWICEFLSLGTYDIPSQCDLRSLGPNTLTIRDYRDTLVCLFVCLFVRLFIIGSILFYALLGFGMKSVTLPSRFTDKNCDEIKLVK